MQDELIRNLTNQLPFLPIFGSRPQKAAFLPKHPPRLSCFRANGYDSADGEFQNPATRLTGKRAAKPLPWPRTLVISSCVW